MPTLASISNDDIYIYGGSKGGDLSGFSLGSGYIINKYTSVETSYAYGDNKGTANYVFATLTLAILDILMPYLASILMTIFVHTLN